MYALNKSDVFITPEADSKACSWLIKEMLLQLQRNITIGTLLTEIMIWVPTHIAMGGLKSQV